MDQKEVQKAVDSGTLTPEMVKSEVIRDLKKIQWLLYVLLEDEELMNHVTIHLCRKYDVAKPKAQQQESAVIYAPGFSNPDAQ